MTNAYSGLKAKTINSFKGHFCINNNLPVRSLFSFYSTYQVLAAIIVSFVWPNYSVYCNGKPLRMGYALCCFFVYTDAEQGIA